MDTNGMTDDARPPMMNIVLPRLSGPELKWLVGWAKVKRESFPTFSRWIVQILMNELDRRTCKEEAGMIELPNWTHGQLADCLLGSYVLCRLPLSQSQAAVADEIHRHIVSNSVAYLEFFSQEATA